MKDNHSLTLFLCSEKSFSPVAFKGTSSYFMEMMPNIIQSDTQIRKILPEKTWIQAKRSHENRFAEFLGPYLEKRSKQQKDPVLDFLFEYYKFRPSHLRKWSPGISSALQCSAAEQLPEFSELVLDDGIAFLHPDFFPQKRLRSVRWMYELLAKSRDKKPLFGCFGMHEWAMVYRAGEVRHQQIPLRLSELEIAEFVESRPLVCTHFDAFRFFTEPAQPMNKHQLSRETFADMEQPGCIHTNMDLYKWAYKLYPWVSGELLADAFFNAVNTRKIDMQASPYDATEFGLEPIKIETEAGRKEYITRQTKIFEESMPVRQRLLFEYEQLLAIVDPESKKISH